MTRLGPAAVVAVLVCSCSTPVTGYRSATLQLKPSMPSEEVQHLLGPPHVVEHATCGTDTGEPWQCRIWQYGSAEKNFMWGDPILRIYFSCVTYTRGDVARALLEQGQLSEDERAVVGAQLESRDLVEECAVNSWNVVE